MRVCRRLLPFLICGLLGLYGALAVAGETAPQREAATPSEVALRFARAFERQDFAVVRSLFAPQAVVLRAVVSPAAAPQMHRYAAEDWASAAERNHTVLKDVKLDILSTREQSFAQGAVVSMHYRFSGKVGAHGFLNEGIDSYSMIRLEGSWRILQYSYIERFEMQ